MLRQRDEPYRNEKLTRLAQDKPCLVPRNNERVIWTHPRSSVVWAHSNLYNHGKGGARKAHDCFGFFACHQCHSMIDQGKLLMRDERRSLQVEAMRATRVFLLKQRLVALDPHTPDFDIEDDERWLEAWRTGALRVAP